MRSPSHRCAVVGWMTAALLALHGGAGAPVLANPLPPAATFIHVQPFNAGDDPTERIVSCEEIQQYTSQTGAMEFDLFIKSFGEWLEDLTSFSGTVTLPADWTLTGYEVASGGTGTVSGVTGEFDLDFTYPGSVSGEVLPVVRLFVHAPGYGQLHSSVAFLNAGGYDMAAEGGYATAGVWCDYCYTDCDFSMHQCTVQFESGQPVTLELDAGTSTQVVLPATTGSVSLCSVQVEDNADWMQTSCAHGEEYWQVNVTVDVDAAGLAPGVYEGWVKLESDCAACRTVELTVLPPTSVPDPDLAPASWSTIKALYGSRER